MSFPNCKVPAPSTRRLIKGLLRRFVTSVCYFSGISHFWYRIFARHSIRILAYHGIEAVPGNSFSVSILNFEKQLQFVKERFNVISLNDIKNMVDGNRSLPADTIAITFDDGFRNFYENAYPIIKKYELPATCFIITSRAGSPDADFMHWNELQNLSDDERVSIGSHTVSHISLKGLDDRLLYHEVCQSRADLEKMLSVTVELFCYPYGTVRDYSHATTQSLKECGYKIACTSINGVNFTSTNMLELHRTKIEGSDDMTVFRRIMFGALDIWILVDRFLYILQKKNEVDFQG
jgi:peptidoglycan/xylan/chitin deacetylase (PgdA/CDA1 family)